MNEIVACGVGYNLVPGLKSFVQTARMYCDKLTIISIGLSADVLEYLSYNNVFVVNGEEYIDKYKVDSKLSAYTLKVIMYYLYCKHECTADNVFLSDLTDVIFQGNPFALIKNDKPYVSIENSNVENCNTNSAWIKHCYNEDIYFLVKNKKIINSGIIFGTKKSIDTLLSDMMLEFQSIISRVGNYLIIDQAALNKIVYFNLTEYNILNNYEMLNMSHTNTVLTKKEVYLVNNEHYPCIIHQYKVNKQTEQMIHEHYSK